MSERLRDGYFAIGVFAGICAALAAMLLWDTLIALVHCRADAQCAEDTLGTGALPHPSLLEVIQRLVSSEDTLANWLATFISLAAVVVSAVAVLFVKQTLDATLQTASAGAAATQAMVEANSIQRAEQRPWCVITWDTACELLEETDGRFSLRWNFHYRNRGRGIAHNVRFRYQVYRYDWGHVGAGRAGVSDVLHLARRSHASGQILFPDEQTEFLHFEDWNMQGIISGEDTGTLFVCACVIYDLDETGLRQGYEAIALVAESSDGQMGPFATKLYRVPEYTLRA